MSNKNKILTLLFTIVFITFLINPVQAIDIPPTPAFSKIHSDNGTINAINYSMPLNVKGSGAISVKSDNSTHTLTISSSASSSSSGTYNTTQANNANVNVGGYKINFINGTNNPVHVVNSPGKNQVNVTISSSGSSGSNTGIIINGLNRTTFNSVANLTSNAQQAFTGNTIESWLGSISNIGLGFQTLKTATSSSMGDTAIGYNALNNIMSGQQNTAVGYQALNTTTGSEDTAIGFDAMYAEQFGNGQNVAIGDQVLSFLTHGQNNIVIGTDAGDNYLSTESNNVLIGKGVLGTTGDQKMLRIGDMFDGDILDGNFGTKLLVFNGPIIVEGKANFTNTGSTIGVNLGTVSSYATSPRKGDIEIVGNSIKYQDNTNTTETLTPGSSGGGTGSYNTTQANNVNVNVGGYKINFINGTNNPVHVVNSPTKNQVNVTISGSSGVSSLNGFTGTVNLNRGLVSNMSSISNNTGSISYQLKNDIFLVNGTAQTITKFFTANLLSASSFIVDATDNTKKLTFLLSGMTTGVTTTIANLATSSQTINIPATRETETYALKPIINYTTPSNPATTTSTTGVMSNLFATFTPQVTGRIKIQICGGMTSGTAGDGAGFDVRYGTSLISEGTAIGNTVVGKEQIITASTVSKFQTACSIGYVTGLTINQKIFIQIGKYAVTGGTATFQNFETYIEEK